MTQKNDHLYVCLFFFVVVFFFFFFLYTKRLLNTDAALDPSIRATTIS